MISAGKGSGNEMKTAHQLLLSIGIVFLFIFFLNVKPQMTGLAVAQDSGPEITITRAEGTGSQGIVEWSTGRASRASFELEGRTAEYDYAKRFEMRLESLKQGKQYNYQITACDRDGKCSQATGTFTSMYPPAITGWTVNDARGLQKMAGAAFLILLAAAVSMVIVNAGLQRLDKNRLMPASFRVKLKLDKAEKALEEKKHHHAFAHYRELKELYGRLGAGQKEKHNKRVMGVYSELLSHNRAKEASYLADRYLSGTISSGEMQRLRELIEN
ncbi:hypothetical protein HYY74_02525 [Candidatus Woesearchaeota archaeon]|nr:hypothetical protein [Candidatus Woesearchaeota archaeon]